MTGEREMKSIQDGLAPEEMHESTIASGDKNDEGLWERNTGTVAEANPKLNSMNYSLNEESLDVR